MTTYPNKFTFHPLSKSDFPLFTRWLGQPHIRQWWHEPATIEHVEKKYGAAINKISNVKIYIAKIKERPIGMVQIYWLRDYPEHTKSVKIGNAIGIDLFIGEHDCLDKGYGSKLISQFIHKVIKEDHFSADGVFADPSVENLRSIRAFEKAGFIKGEVVNSKEGKKQLVILNFT